MFKPILGLKPTIDVTASRYLEAIKEEAPPPDLRPRTMSPYTEACLREYEMNAQTLLPKVVVAFLGITGVMAVTPAIALATLARSPSTAKRISVHFSPRRFFRNRQRMQVLARGTGRRWRVSLGFASLYIGLTVAQHEGWRALFKILEAYKYDEDEEDEKVDVPHDHWLFQEFENLANVISVETPKLSICVNNYEVNANAVCMKFVANDTGCIEITRGALETFGHSERLAVLAHELGHIRHGDSVRGIHLNCMVGGLRSMYRLGKMIILDGTFSTLYGGNAMSDIFDDEGNVYMDDNEAKLSDSGKLVLGGFLCIMGFIGALMGDVIERYVSRQQEHAADAVAVAVLGPDAMLAVLRVFQRIEIGTVEIESGYSALLFATHPSLDERIEFVKQFSRNWDIMDLPTEQNREAVRTTELDVSEQKKTKGLLCTLFAATPASSDEEIK